MIVIYSNSNIGLYINYFECKERYSDWNVLALVSPNEGQANVMRG